MEEENKQTQLERVMEFMRDKEKCEYKEIAKATGIMPHVVSSILSVSTRKGIFVKVTKGVYKLSENN